MTVVQINSVKYHPKIKNPTLLLFAGNEGIDLGKIDKVFASLNNELAVKLFVFAVQKEGGNLTVSGLYAEDTNSFATLYDGMVNGDTFALTFTTGESGDSVWYADAIITSMELSAPNDENVTYSISFEFTGEVVRS